MNQQNSQMIELNELEKLKHRIAELENREKQLLKNLRLNISLHSKILDALPINIFLEDPEGRTIFVNNQACKAHGVTAEELVGKTVFDFFPNDIAMKHREIDLEVWARKILQTNEVATEFQGKKGHMLTGKTIIQLEDTNKEYLLGFGLDITDLKNAEEKIFHMAYNDALTGLPNRWFIKSCLKNLNIDKKIHTMKGVLLLDLDHFKVINDSLGHEAGDQLLQLVASRLGEVKKAENVLARFGGDEFIIIIPELLSTDEALDVAEEIVKVMKNPFFIYGQKFTISPSIGISLYPNHGEDMETLIKNADLAMYPSKEQGRNCYSLFTPLMKEKAIVCMSMLIK
ncbi:sensor domain-containing diguanylate cyclase [Neobacillus sp. CF12]|uniref:sensor domain-containing diguanylate cyclase n=1 Tax=Neobacillus sp. CF12 TaxID=3055864 RepID=UPI0025A1D916|nr:sensor domain-containing diguanylate cyclase [Neobacillus sp. CF12]MDM5328460.1 diguanylate cyclase [Neobacillus sp. CF12]